MIEVCYRPWRGPIKNGAACLLGFFLVVALPVQAHHLPPELEDVDEFADEAFKAGLRHPGRGIDHWLLAAVAGVLAAGAVRRNEMTLTAAAYLGGLSASALLPAVQTAHWPVLVLASALLLAGGRLPVPWRLTLLASAALLQGMEHATAWPWENVKWSYMSGVLTTSSGLFLAAAAVARLAGLSWSGRRAPAAA